MGDEEKGAQSEPGKMHLFCFSNFICLDKYIKVPDERRQLIANILFSNQTISVSFENTWKHLCLRLMTFWVLKVEWRINCKDTWKVTILLKRSTYDIACCAVGWGAREIQHPGTPVGKWLNACLPHSHEAKLCVAKCHFKTLEDSKSLVVADIFVYWDSTATHLTNWDI